MTFKMKYTLYGECPALTANIRVQHVHPVGSANGIIWTAKTKSPNLFVEVKVDGVVMQSTTVIERKKSPVWNQELIMYVSTCSSLLNK
jgi:C2 domain